MSEWEMVTVSRTYFITWKSNICPRENADTYWQREGVYQERTYQDKEYIFWHPVLMSFEQHPKCCFSKCGPRPPAADLAGKSIKYACP